MRILLVNYRYFVSGGPERYLFTIRDALTQQGHEVIPFSVAYDRNEPTPYAKYFVPPLAGESAVYFDQHAWTPGSFLKTLERSFYSREVEQAVARLIDEARPDVAYVLHYLKKLSPSVLAGIRRRNLPIVVRLSDFLMLCPQALFLRDGRPCTLCADGSLWPSLRYRCVKGSLGASAVHLLSTYHHRRRRYFDLIDRFIVPSAFMLEKMVEAGWPRDRFVHLPTPAAPEFFEPPPARETPATPFILFVGHFDAHKGPDVLIRAFAEARRRDAGFPARLVMAGALNRPFAGVCRALAAELGVATHVDFVGFKDPAELRALYASAQCTVIPSTCYENMPNVIMESYAGGTPVVGSAHGSIRELIREGETGYGFEPGSADDLARCLAQAMDSSWRAAAGKAARTYALENFQLERHVAGLLDTLDSVTGKERDHAR